MAKYFRDVDLFHFYFLVPLSDNSVDAFLQEFQEENSSFNRKGTSRAQLPSLCFDLLGICVIGQFFSYVWKKTVENQMLIYTLCEVLYILCLMNVV